jgi:choline kinase
VAGVTRCDPPSIHGATIETVVVLAAGLGTRLGQVGPKPLTRLANGRTMIAQQFDRIAAELPDVSTALVVVGYGKELVMEHLADQAAFVFNPRFRETNTAKSLLAALNLAPPGGVLWLNGDVVFSEGLLDHLRHHVGRGSFVAVNSAVVGEEEVKYTLDAAGNIDQLSKQVVDGLGEAVGINYVAGVDRDALVGALVEALDQDYFEKGLEQAIFLKTMTVRAVDVSAFGIVEVDFPEDLTRANSI